jgi:hypothetical protein
MATPKYRHYVLFVKGRKAGLAHGLALDGTSGDEVQFDANGIAGLSDGIAQFKISADTLTPVAGDSTVDWEGIFVNKTEVEVKFFAGGKTTTFPARITTFHLESKSQSGVATGRFEFTQAGEASVS